LVFSDVGSGFFSTANNGAAGNQTLTLNIASGNSTGTVYFGGQNTGPDSISVVNGTNVWGTAPLTIVSGTPTQVAITPSTTTPGVSSTTNTTLSFQLEDAFGNYATTATPLTLSLSAGTGGYFAGSSGTTGTPTFSVPIASGAGSATAYFGSQVSGADTVTAKNGATSWGTSVLTLAPGTASQVQVTLSPSPPLVSTHGTTNTTVTLQLQDQFGNNVPTSGVVFTLSNSATGFFSKNSGVVGTATVTLNATNTSGTATGYFGDTTAQSDTITATSTGITFTTPAFTV
jgi:hypothetical protein